MTKIHLMVKMCPHCGLKYFCKTTTGKTEAYAGSGVHWVRHLRRYGVKPLNLLVKEYDGIENASKIAIRASRIWHIVDSPNWANKMEENALNGWPDGEEHPMKKDTARQAMRLKFLNKPLSDGHKLNILKSMQKDTVRSQMRENHADFSGDKNPRSKITRVIAQTILDSDGTHEEIAKKFATTYGIVYRIRKRHSWKSLLPSRKTKIVNGNCGKKKIF